MSLAEAGRRSDSFEYTLALGKCGAGWVGEPIGRDLNLGGHHQRVHVRISRVGTGKLHLQTDTAQ